MSGAPPPRRPAAGEPLSPADVVAGYRWILGRAPENEAVIGRQIAAAGTMEVLRHRLLTSAEFRTVGEVALAPPLPLDAPGLAVETEAAPAEVEAMLARVAAHWTRLGEAAPHWSVRREERFRPERLQEHRRAFTASGGEDRALLEGILARHGILPERLRHAVDFGCGVGRATLHFAALCPEVTGVDISAPHLAAARAEARARGMDHIAWLRARPDQPMPAGPSDLWFSRRVLQHNPPPVMRALLRGAFAGLAPCGVAVFQLPTYGTGYCFARSEHLAGPLEGADEREETHVLPQAEVFALAAEAGLAVLEVSEDVLAGLDRRRWVSHLFVLRRPG